MTESKLSYVHHRLNYIQEGWGWFDLTIKQVDLLDESDIALLAVRVQGNKVYYLDFKQLRNLMTTKNIHENSREGKHWKFYIWKDCINVRGSTANFVVEPVVLV